MKLFKNALMTGLMLVTAAPMVVPAAAQAQSRNDSRNDRQDARDGQRDVRHGNARNVREERRDVRDTRQDYRQDLRDHRSHRASNRNAYRGTRFSANFRYQNFRPGARINANYYAPRYVVSNYRNYRLPHPGARQAWVRHYNDVLLIDIRNGRVLRAIPNFYY